MEKTQLNELTDKVLTFRDARNWKQFHSPKNLAMGLSIEAAELQELFLWKKNKRLKTICRPVRATPVEKNSLMSLSTFYLAEARDRFTKHSVTSSFIMQRNNQSKKVMERP